MQTGGHILSELNEALKSFRDMTLNIATLAQQNLEQAMLGLFERKPELCNKVIADDEEVDQLEIRIDESAVQIMTKYHPFASDLRVVIASMKITNSLERISDHAVSIAKRSRKLLRHQEVAEIALLEPVFQLANQLLSDALASYADSDIDRAHSVIQRDSELDELHKRTTKILTKCLETPETNHKSYINLVFICRWLERVGDLSVNIAEDVVFMETATDIRHRGDSNR